MEDSLVHALQESVVVVAKGTTAVALNVQTHGRKDMEHRPLIDQLTSMMIEKKELNESMSLEEPSEEEIQNLKYRRGEKLIDSVTGKEVTILAGKRAFGKVPGS